MLAWTASSSQEAKKDPEKKALKKNPFAELVKLTPEEFIKRFDKDGDGKLSRDEVPPFLGKVFQASDKNGDGKLDRAEVVDMLKLLRSFAAQGGPPPNPGIAEDFDALDKNADGRLTREELKGTRWFDRFDEIDTDRNGMIDRTEFEAFLRRESAKKAPAEKK